MKKHLGLFLLKNDPTPVIQKDPGTTSAVKSNRLLNCIFVGNFCPECNEAIKPPFASHRLCVVFLCTKQSCCKRKSVGFPFLTTPQLHHRSRLFQRWTTINQWKHNRWQWKFFRWSALWEILYRSQLHGLPVLPQ